MFLKNATRIQLIIPMLLMITIFISCNPSGNRAEYSKTPFDPYQNDGTILEEVLKHKDSLAHQDPTPLHIDTTIKIEDSSAVMPADTLSHTP